MNMRKMKSGGARRLGKLSCLCAALVMAGCSTMNEANQSVDHAKQTIASSDASLRALAPAPVVQSSRDDWILGAPMVRQVNPGALDQHVEMATAQPMTLSQIAMFITQQTGVAVQIAPSALPKRSGSSGSKSAQRLPGLPGLAALTMPSLPGVSKDSSHVVINYSGKLKGLFDLIAAQTHTYWRYSAGEHAVQFFVTETRVFEVNALPGQSTMNASISNSGTGGSASGGSSGGSQGPSLSGTSTQGAAMNVALDPYKAIENGIKTVLKQSGASQSAVTSVSVDPSSGQIIVTASPPELDAVAQYVSAINAQMERNVLVDVRVYSVDLTANSQMSLNLDAALSNITRNLGTVSITGASSAAATAGGTLGASIFSGSFSSHSIAQALSAYGHVALVTSGSVIALNGQPAPLQVSKSAGYLAQSTTTTTANVGSQTTLMPGSVISGFSGTFLPLVRGNRILLEYALNLTQNLGFLTVASGGSSIQVPNTSSQTMANKVALKSGDTVVLTGFEQASNSAGASTDIGDYANKANRERTALVITMHVVNIGN